MMLENLVMLAFVAVLMFCVVLYDVWSVLMTFCAIQFISPIFCRWHPLRYNH